MRCSWPGRGAAEPATRDPLQQDRPYVTTRSSCISQQSIRRIQCSVKYLYYLINYLYETKYIFQSGMRFTRGLILIHQLVGLYHNCNFLRKFDLSN